jgi:quercetin dioxygenase-like cupin family protein
MATNQTHADPVSVDPKHYKVELENDKVRVLRATYGPGETSEMHSHPDTLAVFLSDADFKFAFPDGKTEDIRGKKGDVVSIPAMTHLPENVSDEGAEIILIELKS